VDHLTAKLVVVNLVKLHLTKLKYILFLLINDHNLLFPYLQEAIIIAREDLGGMD